MEVVELPLGYVNKLASQIISISALLGGFSLTVLVMLIDRKGPQRLMKNIFRLAAFSTCSFLVAIFGMTNILMMTTEGFPFPVEESDIAFPRLAGTLAFFLGIIGVLAIVSALGWTQSKGLGIFTTIIGGLSLLFILAMLT